MPNDSTFVRKPDLATRHDFLLRYGLFAGGEWSPGEGGRMPLLKRPRDRRDAEPDIQPMLLVDVKNFMRIGQKEIFEPITSAITFNDENEVIRAATDAIYDLAAESGSKTWRGRFVRPTQWRQARSRSTANIVLAIDLARGGYKQSDFASKTADQDCGH